MKTESLRQIACKNETSRAIFHILESRDRFRTATDLRLMYYELKKEHDIDVVHFLATWLALEKLGIGKLRRGGEYDPDRFIWNYNLKEVARAARQGTGIADLKLLKERERRPLDNPIAKAEALLIERDREEHLKEELDFKLQKQNDPFSPELKEIVELLKNPQATIFINQFFSWLSNFESGSKNLQVYDSLNEGERKTG